MMPAKVDEKSPSFVTEEKALETTVLEQPIVEPKASSLDKLTQWLSRWGVETQGYVWTSSRLLSVVFNES